MSRPPYLPSDPNETDNLSRYAPAYKPGDVRALGAAPGLNSYKVGSAESIARRVQAQGRRAMMQDPRVQQYLAPRPWDIASVMQTGMTNAGLANAAQQAQRSDAMFKSNLDTASALAKETGYSNPTDALAFLRQRAELDAQTKRLGNATTGLKLQTDAAAYAAGHRLSGQVASSNALTPEAAALQALARAGYSISPEQITAASRANADRTHARDMVDYNATSTARAAGVAPGSRTEAWYAQREADKRAKDAADAAHTATSTAKLAKPTDSERLDDLLARAHSGDWEAAKQYNLIQQRIVEGRGGIYNAASKMPDSPEAWATSRYKDKPVPGAKQAPAQWQEGQLARGRDGTVRRYVGGKWVAE